MTSLFLASRPSLTRHGFCWRVLYFTTAAHPAGVRYGGYYKHIRAWTPWGALRIARRLRHQKWDVEIVGRG